MMNASFLVRKLGERSLPRRFNSSSSLPSERTVPLADEVGRSNNAAFTKRLLLPEPKPNNPKSLERRSSPRSVEKEESTSSQLPEEEDVLITARTTGSLLVDSDDEDERSLGIEDSYYYPDKMDEQDGGELDGTSSGAVSLESSRDDLECFAEFALVDDQSIKTDSFDASTDLNTRKGSSWADFSSTTANKSEASTSRARCATESWERKRRRKSWLDQEDLLNQEHKDDAAQEEEKCEQQEEEEEVEPKEEMQSTEPTKMVRFHLPLRRQLDVRPHLSRSDMTWTELHATWYDEYDLEEMQMGVLETLVVLRHSAGATKREGHGLCPRGLEHVIDEGLARRRERRKAEVVEAVMRVQQQQQQRGDINDGHEEAIAEVSRRLSREGAAMAGLMGKSDSAAARLVLGPQRFLEVHGTSFVGGVHRQRGSLTPAAA